MIWGYHYFRKHPHGNLSQERVKKCNLKAAPESKDHHSYHNGVLLVTGDKRGCGLTTASPFFLNVCCRSPLADVLDHSNPTYLD